VQVALLLLWFHASTEPGRFTIVVADIAYYAPIVFSRRRTIFLTSAVCRGNDNSKLCSLSGSLVPRAEVRQPWESFAV
jgi:hypothetical protein